MQALSTQCQLNPSDEVNAQTILEYTELMFAKNDHFHQQGMFTKQIAEVYMFRDRITSPFLDSMK